MIKEVKRLVSFEWLSVSQALSLEGEPQIHETDMAVNKPIGDGHRIGAVRERTQVLNPVTEIWTKRDTSTGQFMDGKANGQPFKGVTKEKK